MQYIQGSHQGVCYNETITHANIVSSIVTSNTLSKSNRFFLQYIQAVLWARILIKIQIRSRYNFSGCGTGFDLAKQFRIRPDLDPKHALLHVYEKLKMTLDARSKLMKFSSYYSTIHVYITKNFVTDTCLSSSYMKKLLVYFNFLRDIILRYNRFLNILLPLK